MQEDESKSLEHLAANDVSSTYFVMTFFSSE